MRAVAAVAVVVAAVLFGAACASEGVPEVPVGPGGEPDQVLVAGRQVYIDRCANCHGSAGGGGRGTRLADGAATRSYPTLADQNALVSDGVRAMPGFEDVLSPSEIEAVNRFIREIL